MLADDVFIPGIPLQVSEITRKARLEASQGDPEPVRDGSNRPTSDDPFLWQRKEAWSRATEEDVAAFDMHSWLAGPGDWIAYRLEQPTQIRTVTLVLDSNLERGLKHPSVAQSLPPSLPNQFRVEILKHQEWELLSHCRNNTQRLVIIPVNQCTTGVRLVVEETHGHEQTRLYGLYLSQV